MTFQRSTRPMWSIVVLICCISVLAKSWPVWSSVDSGSSLTQAIGSADSNGTDYFDCSTQRLSIRCLSSNPLSIVSLGKDLHGRLGLLGYCKPFLSIGSFASTLPSRCLSHTLYEMRVSLRN